MGSASVLGALELAGYLEDNSIKEDPPYQLGTHKLCIRENLLVESKKVAQGH